jgi:hypothetical protein
MISTTLDTWEDPSHEGDPQAAFDNFERARTDPADGRHEAAIAASLLVLPGDLGPNWEDPRHVGQPRYSRWPVPGIGSGPHSGNNERESFRYTVVDLRGGGVQLYPPVTERPVSQSSGRPFTATSVRREVRAHEPRSPGPSSAAVVENRLLHGGSSIRCWLVDMDPKQGRWYPYAMEGICPGQLLFVEQPGSTPLFVTVHDVGWDPDHTRPDGAAQPLPYFTVVADPATPLPPDGVPVGDEQTRITRKTFLDPLSIIGEDHTPNQSAGALLVDKYAFSDGDSFVGAFHLTFQGDFDAGGGDEGGLGGSFELKQDLRVFSGEVDSFRMVPLYPEDPSSVMVGQLTYRAHSNVERIGAGRAIINMKDKTELTGTCSLWLTSTYRGSLSFGKGVIEVPAGSLPDVVVGRFFAVDEPSERIDPDDAFCRAAQDILRPAHVLRRWFQITSLVRDAMNGSQLLQVRAKREDAYQGGPDLIDQSHYATYDDHRPVKFVIRRGAIPFDVSGAVAESDNAVSDNVAVNRVMLMQPNADMVSGSLPFAQGHPVEQALGSRCWNPTGVRVRHLTAWPSQEFIKHYRSPDISFFSDNLGSASVGIGLALHDRSDGALEKARAVYRGGIGFETGVCISATTRTAIAVAGDVEQTAIEVSGHVTLPEDRAFRGVGRPDAGVALLLDQTGPDDVRKTRARKVIAWTAADAPGDLMTLGYDGVGDVFRIAGARTVALKGTTALDLGGARVVNAGTSNVHGTTAMPAGSTGASGSITARVNLPSPMTGDYVAMVSPGWVTGFGVTKDQAGFTVEFEKPPPEGRSPSSTPWAFDWMVRETP